MKHITIETYTGNELIQVYCQVCLRANDIRGKRQLDVDNGECPGISDYVKAREDATVFGTGFLYNGIRLDPEKIQIFRINNPIFEYGKGPAFSTLK